jgi:hypothetical protein
MLYLRRLIHAALTALVVTSPAVFAERSVTSHQRPAFSQVRPKVTDLAKDVAPVSNLATIPRGGKAEAVSKSFVSQSASVIMGLILALNSGLINGCALSGVVTADGSSQAVAAVTASWTNSALGLASGNLAKFGFLSKVIGSFIFGSFIAGYLQPKPSPFLISTSSYGAPLTIAALATVLSKVCLEDKSLIKIGFYLLCVANGINNSITSSMTSNLCRTSHFTGISSDMGTFLGQILRGNTANLFKLKVFAALAASFWAGGFLSFELTKAYGASSLYVSAAIYLFMAVGYEKLAKSIFSE